MGCLGRIIKGVLIGKAIHMVAEEAIGDRNEGA
jgi:hypothetical protein